MQPKGQNRGNLCIDSRFQAQTCESMQRRGQNGGNPSSPREDGIVPRPGNAGWTGTSDGVAARGFVNVKEGPTAQRWEGKHRRCAPVRSPCPQADSDAERRPCPQADSDAETAQSPAGRVGSGNTQDQAQKKESRLIAESGLSKRGSYLLSHLV